MVGQLIQNTPGTISLAQGVVSYGPPLAAMEIIRSFGSDPADHLYGPVQGIPELISVIENKLQKDNHISGDISKRIIVTAGANMAFLNALFAITDPGDEIILPTPYYFNHEMAIRMVNCTPLGVKTGADFQPCPEEIEKAITPRTRAVVTISPNNPAGIVYPEKTLREINRICAEHGIYHICDEAYEYFTYDRAKHFSPGSIKNADGHTISLYSLSKTYGFASWRIGYMLIPKSLYSPILKAQDTNLICATRIAQKAAIVALATGSAYCLEKREDIDTTRQHVIAALESIRNFSTFPSADGAFYILMRIDTDKKCMTLVRELIEKYRIAVLPGDAFGIDDGCYLRISYGALEADMVEKGIHRLINGLKHLV